MRRVRVLLLLLCAFVAPVAEAAAQSQAPRRPKLPLDADTNDFLAYYRRGLELMKNVPAEAADAFYWAARLNPAVAEPDFARGVALWRSRPELLADYVEGSFEAAKMGAPFDSLIYHALMRNPLVDQRLTLWMYERLPGEWSTDYVTRGQRAYGNSKYQEAVKWYTRALAERDGRRIGALYERALAYVAMQQYDSALADLGRLVETMRQRDVRRLVRAYDSKAMFEYAAGSIHMQRKDYARAREAFGRALGEDLSLYTAHMALGDVARLQGDTALAIQEYGQAVELGPRDANLRFVFGTVLFQAGHHQRAIEQFRAATELEPHWAVPYMNLGFALEKADDASGAVRAYEEFVRRAPRAGLEAQVDYATRRSAALRR